MRAILTVIAIIWASTQAFAGKNIVGKEYVVPGGVSLVFENEDPITNQGNHRFVATERCATRDGATLRVTKVIGDGVLKVVYLFSGETMNLSCPDMTVSTTTVSVLEEAAWLYESEQRREEARKYLEFLESYLPKKDE